MPRQSRGCDRPARPGVDRGQLTRHRPTAREEPSLRDGRCEVTATSVHQFRTPCLARAWTWALRPGRSATSLAGSGPARGARGRPAGAIQASEDPVHPSGPLAGRRIRWGVQLLHPSVSTLVARATRATRHARSDSGYSRDIGRLSPRSISRWLRDQGSDQRVCACSPNGVRTRVSTLRGFSRRFRHLRRCDEMAVYLRILLLLATRPLASSCGTPRGQCGANLRRCLACRIVGQFSGSPACRKLGQVDRLALAAMGTQADPPVPGLTGAAALC
jgi:hypothetical protein